ncbi:hypothetical protein ACWCO0_28065 [Streptomyces tubercidicus]
MYTAVGPRLRGFPGATELLRGVGYAAAVCRANVALADVVQGESDQGLFKNGSRITLDDAFEGGGVWRCHHPGETETPGDPFAPAGRGWTSTLPAQSELEAELDPVDSSLADGASLGVGELLRNDGKETVWRAPLRLAHLIEGWFPLHPYVVEELGRSRGACPRLCLELDHVGEASGTKEVTQDVTAEIGDESGRLTGIAWPHDLGVGEGRGRVTGTRALRFVRRRTGRNARLSDIYEGLSGGSGGSVLLIVGLLGIDGCVLVSRCGGPTQYHRPCRRRRIGLFARCQDHGFTLVTVTDLAGLVLFGLAFGVWTLFGAAG